MSLPPELSVSPERPEVVTREPQRARAAWASLMSATDHKQVGVLYIVTALCALVLATCLLVLMRVQLIVPENTMIDAVIFNRLLSAYGATAIVLFALPLAIGFATYVTPLQIGARSVALPRLAAFSYWIYLLGGVTLYASFLYRPSEAGTLAFPPLSSDDFLAGNGVDAWIVGVGLAVLGLLLAAINLLVTVVRHRAPGMAWRRMPLFAWSSTVLSSLLLVTAPVLLAALTMLFYDRQFGGFFFEAGGGGEPLLYQHLVWIFFTAAYAGLIVFAAGVISEIVPALSGRPSFSHRASMWAIAGIAALAPFAWMQNMYTSDISPGWLYFAMAAAIALVVPVGVLFFNWLATMWDGALRLRAPLLFALGAISAISFGLAGELAHSVIPVGWQLKDTMAAWQDTHYALVGAAVFGGLAALYWWFPKITGRTMGEGLGRASFWSMLVGLHVLCVPMFLAGVAGQPVDVWEYYSGNGIPAYNLIASIGAFVLAIGVLLSLANAARSVRGGAPAGHDVWGAGTLEWFAESPPPPHNFDAIPDVRTAQPLHDIREAVRRRTESYSAPVAERHEPQPDPAASAAGPGGERGGPAGPLA